LAEGTAQAETTLVDWDGALAEMRRTFPGYVANFEALEAMAPAQDLRALQFLTEHERAAIAFLELELSNPKVSMEPLTIYLNSSVDSLEQVDRE
jgi:dimethylamine/trimethylamine dehydrogenase